MHSVPGAPGSDRPIMKLALGAPLGGGWSWCLLLQDIGVTRQAFQYDPRAQLSPASSRYTAVTRTQFRRHDASAPGETYHGTGRPVQRRA
eukprot:COSAG01_NODE_3887_length_5585_cov_3.982501_3_plen_90_part_00